jgi:hypothetical protein
VEKGVVLGLKLLLGNKMARNHNVILKTNLSNLNQQMEKLPEVG